MDASINVFIFERISPSFLNDFNVFHGSILVLILYAIHAIYIIPETSPSPSTGYPENERTHPAWVFRVFGVGIAHWIATVKYDNVRRRSVWKKVSLYGGKCFPFSRNIFSDLSRYLSSEGTDVSNNASVFWIMNSRSGWSSIPIYPVIVVIILLIIRAFGLSYFSTILIPWRPPPLPAAAAPPAAAAGFATFSTPSPRSASIISLVTRRNPASSYPSSDTCSIFLISAPLYLSTHASPSSLIVPRSLQIVSMTTDSEFTLPTPPCINAIAIVS